MYQQHFGFREPPFELTPNPRYLFLTAQHREALSTLIYGLSQGKALTVLVGEAGTGKTTVLHSALQTDQCSHVTAVHVTNPTLTRAEFIELLSMQFRLSPNATRSKAAFLTEFSALLRDRRQRGQVTAIVVDEAQSLTDELLEEVRLLANNETSTEKLLALVMAGQPELRDRLNTTELRQLKQRITLRSELMPFSLHDTAAYIAARIRVAGGDAWRVFTREAVMLIHQRSGGIPRTINVICDNALMTAFAVGKQPIDVAMVMEVVRDFDFISHTHVDAQERAALLTPPSAESTPSVPDVSTPSLEPRLAPVEETTDSMAAARARRLSILGTR